MKIYYKRSVKANITITSKPWLKIKTWAITALPPFLYVLRHFAILYNGP
jgi:hypothetical protein